MSLNEACEAREKKVDVSDRLMMNEGWLYAMAVVKNTRTLAVLSRAGKYGVCQIGNTLDHP